jgi:uncharacterized protein
VSTRIVVIADTHMPRRRREIPLPVLRDAARADLLVHLGDFDGAEVLDSLREVAPLHGVHGNNDSLAVQALFPAEARLTVEGRRLALIHGHLGGRTAREAALRVRDADIVLFGHSHIPSCSTEKGTVLLNPGSPTERRWAPYRSYGVIVLGEGIRASVVPLS